MSRDSTSRPNASVPSQCAALGRESMAPKSTATGLYGAIRFAVSAIRMRRMTTAAPAAPSGRRTGEVPNGPPPAGPGFCGGGDLDGVERDVDGHGYRYRMRGSSQPYMRSMKKLTMMKTEATSSTSAWVSV